jgi:hypothetical protein
MALMSAATFHFFLIVGGIALLSWLFDGQAKSRRRKAASQPKEPSPAAPRDGQAGA